MNTFHYSRILFFFTSLTLLFYWSCSDDDTGTPTLPVSAGTVSSLAVADVGDAGNGSDLQISFSPATDENKVASYRIIVVKSNSANAFNLSAAEALAVSNYTAAAKTGNQINATLAATATDTDGELIANDIPYKVFVLSVADGSNATENTLSAASSEIVLATVQTEVLADAAMNILLEDVADNGNGSDLMVTFEKAADEGTVSAYRVFVVQSSMTATFSIDEANQNNNYFETLPSGVDVSAVLPAETTDSQGNTISNNSSYVAFILSVSDGQNATLNALSAPSNEVTLASLAGVTVTYICNDGIMISNGNQTVLIDAMNRWGNLTGWVRPNTGALEAIENGDAPYDDIDIIMITHAHTDHFATPAVSNYLSNHPNTKLMAPPQVLASFPTFSSQIVDLSVQQFDKEKVTVNGVEIDVLYIKHFNQFSYNFCNVQNYGYVVHMNGKKFMHLGDVDMINSNMDQMDLVAENIDVAFIPTFGDLVNNTNKTALMDNANPKDIVALHFLISQINGSMTQVGNVYPDAFIFDVPFETVEF